MAIDNRFEAGLQIFIACLVRAAQISILVVGGSELHSDVCFRIRGCVLRGKIEIRHQIEAIVRLQHLFDGGKSAIPMRLLVSPFLDLLP